jgi:hypothetical protein
MTVQVQTTGGENLISVVCPAQACGWTGTGFNSGDSLFWQSNGATGPLTLNFPGGIAAAGAFIQADVPGPFTARIEAFNGKNQIGSFDALSDSTGKAVYLGIRDSSGPNITSVSLGVVAAAANSNDFAIGSVSIDPGPLRITVSTNQLTFAQQELRTASSSQAVRVTNTGPLPFPVSVSITGDFQAANDCPTALTASAYCTINVTFLPTAVGTRSGQLTVGAGAPGIGLTGTAVNYQRSGTFGTSDPADLISWSTTPNVVDKSIVEFQLCQVDALTWRKTMILKDGTGAQFTMTIADSTKCDTNSLWATQVNNGQSFPLLKAKFLGIMTQVANIKLSDFLPLPGGSRLTLVWLRD